MSMNELNQLHLRISAMRGQQEKVPYENQTHTLVVKDEVLGWIEDARRKVTAQSAVRQPLTDEQIADLVPLMQAHWTPAIMAVWMARAVERAHGIESLGPITFLRASQWGRVYDTASRLIAAIGYHGERSTHDDEVLLLSDALADLDNGEHIPGLMPAFEASAPIATPECQHCGGAGEFFDHADDCRDDLCALNGDIHSCAGVVVKCDCQPFPTTTEPNAMCRGES